MAQIRSGPQGSDRLEPRSEIRGLGLHLVQQPRSRLCLEPRGQRAGAIDQKLMRLESQALSQLRVRTQADVSSEVRGQDWPGAEGRS